YSVSESWGFLYEYLLHCPAPLGGSLFTIFLPGLCPASAGPPFRCGAPFCCGLLQPSVACSALLVESLCYGRLPRQQKAASALGGTSVGGNSVSSGGCPSRTVLH
ncbi:hypothetical protein P7K49_039573, partial [Saguinus oedipus]